MSNKNEKKEVASQKTAPPTPTTGVPEVTASENSETAVVMVDGNSLKEREAVVKVAVALKVRSDEYTILKGAVHVCEGYVWGWLKKSYPDTEEGKADFEKLVKSTGLGSRMVARYIQLAEKLVASRKLDAKTQVLLDDAIEKGNEISVEIVNKVADKVGHGKTMTDLMREVGILPPLDTKPKREASLKDKLLHAVKQTTAACTNLQALSKSILESDDNVLKSQFQDAVTTLILELQNVKKELEAERDKVQKEIEKRGAVLSQQREEMVKVQGEVETLKAQKAERELTQLLVAPQV